MPSSPPSDDYPRLLILAATLALAASPAWPQTIPGYHYGRDPDGKPFWFQCGDRGYCDDESGDPGDGGRRPSGSSRPQRVDREQARTMSGTATAEQEQRAKWDLLLGDI